jgi:hypothetical protein
MLDWAKDSKKSDKGCHMRRIGYGSVLLIIALSGFALSTLEARSLRVDNETGVWAVVPSSILQQLPQGLGFPAGLKIGVLGASPVTVDQLSGPTAPSTVRAGFTIVNGKVVPQGVAVAPSLTSPAFDAQGPFWLPAPMPVVCPAYPLLSYYACPTNHVAGIKIEWGVPAFEQVVFLNLGSPRGVELYDSNDYTCTPQGIDSILGTPCQYDNVGNADDAWEFEFNCAPLASGVTVGCASGAALQWRGMLYTASADVLDAPSYASPDGQSPALNEFVFTAGKLYAPPGWQSFIVTLTGMIGPRCEFVAGAPLNFYALVAAYGFNGIPSGTATLLDGTTPLETETLDNIGAVKFTTSLASGTHSLSVAYQGSSTYAPSQSAADVLVSKDLSPNCPNH